MVTATIPNTARANEAEMGSPAMTSSWKVPIAATETHTDTTSKAI